MTNVLTVSQVEEIVKGIIEAHTYLDRVGEGFEGEIYVDYRDGLSESTIEEITSAGDMMEAFNEVLWGMEVEQGDYEFGELLNTIKNNWDEEEHGELTDEIEDMVVDYVRDNVSFHLPTRHFVEQELLVNIMVDTGDGNYDYTLNNLTNFYAEHDDEEGPEVDEESSLVWLARQQGYSKERLEEAIQAYYNGDEIKSKLLKSIVRESANTTTSMNALTFFVKMDLESYMDMMDNGKGVILSEGTSVGLYDPWNGAGGTLEIELENPVVIPANIIEAHIDGQRGYGVDSIYGMSSSHWTQTIENFIEKN